MNNLLFITRSWGPGHRNWIHEYQIFVFFDTDHSVYRYATRKADSRCPHHAWMPGDRFDLNEHLFSPRPIEPYSGIFTKTPFTVIYMDNAWVCPFCGSIELERDYSDSDPRKSQWLALRYISFRPDISVLTTASMAIVQTVAHLNSHTLPFRFKTCSACHKHIHRPIISMPCPSAKNRDTYESYGYYPYEKTARHITSDTDRAAWWETKLICHGRSIAKTPARSIKKAIERRLRRKRLTIAEHNALSMMLAPSIIKQRLKSA